MSLQWADVGEIVGMTVPEMRALRTAFGEVLGLGPDNHVPKDLVPVIAFIHRARQRGTPDEEVERQLRSYRAQNGCWPEEILSRIQTASAATAAACVEPPPAWVSTGRTSPPPPGLGTPGADAPWVSSDVATPNELLPPYATVDAMSSQVSSDVATPNGLLPGVPATAVDVGHVSSDVLTPENGPGAAVSGVPTFHLVDVESSPPSDRSRSAPPEAPQGAEERSASKREVAPSPSSSSPISSELATAVLESGLLTDGEAQIVRDTLEGASMYLVKPQAELPEPMVREMVMDLRREICTQTVEERELMYRMNQLLQELIIEVRDLRYAFLLASSRKDRKRGKKVISRLLS